MERALFEFDVADFQFKETFIVLMKIQEIQKTPEKTHTKFLQNSREQPQELMQKNKKNITRGSLYSFSESARRDNIGPILVHLFNSFDRVFLAVYVAKDGLKQRFI